MNYIGSYYLQDSNDKPFHVFVKNDRTGLFFWLGDSGIMLSRSYIDTKIIGVDFIDGCD
jgi:hypothetical protein